jgi:hypothetical protein
VEVEKVTLRRRKHSPCPQRHRLRLLRGRPCDPSAQTVSDPSPCSRQSRQPLLDQPRQSPHLPHHPTRLARPLRRHHLRRPRAGLKMRWRRCGQLQRRKKSPPLPSTPQHTCLLPRQLFPPPSRRPSSSRPRQPRPRRRSRRTRLWCSWAPSSCPRSCREPASSACRRLPPPQTAQVRSATCPTSTRSSSPLFPPRRHTRACQTWLPPRGALHPGTREL